MSSTASIALHAFCRRRPVTAYALLAFVLSWSYWLTLVGLGQRVEPGSPATHLPGLAGPFFAALIVTALADGAAGVRAFLVRCLRLPAPRLRSLAWALSPLALGLGLFAALAAFGRPWPAASAFNTFPGAPQGWPLPATGLLALALNGFGEEGGWRGFVLPQLARRMPKLQAALAVAGLWLSWHAPLFVLNTSMSALLGPTLLGWALGLAAGAVVLAWLYLATESVLVVALWHTAFNFMVATEPGRGTVAAVLSTLVMVLAIVIARRWWRR